MHATLYSIHTGVFEAVELFEDKKEQRWCDVISGFSSRTRESIL